MDELDSELDALCPRKKDRFGPRVKKHGMISGTTKHARNLYLYGNGDGKPIRTVDKLAELSGLHRTTVQKHLPAWEQEALAIARRESPAKILIPDRITAKETRWHGGQVESLRVECERLAATVKGLTPGSDLHRDTLKTYLATMKKWEESSGFSAAASTAEKLRLENLRLVREHGRGGPDEMISDSETLQAHGFQFALED